MEEILTKLVSGAYSDWFLDVFMGEVAKAVKNNLGLLIVFSMALRWIATHTKNTYDDYLAKKLEDWLGRNKTNAIKKEIQEDEKKIMEL